MKLLFSTIIVCVAFISSGSAQADASLVKLGGGIRGHLTSPKMEVTTTSANQTVQAETEYENTSYASLYAQIQVGVPFVPSLRLSSYSFKPKQKDSHNTLPLSHQRAELFYSFSFAIVEAQVGATLNNFSIGDENTTNQDTDYSGTGVSTRLIFDIPAVPLTPSVNIDFGVSDDKANSYELNIAYNLFVGLYLDAGIQNYSYTFDHKNNDVETDGKTTNNTVYLGISFNVGL